ncbi:MAG TPA: TetR/AcrR family transcriptional regulator C-terminal domain-containing protein [Sporichthya sp.]|nr:TetR/AcrR family transcriptional regulator C-terminal domain-containing protein [Sporichthya sp.]
MKAPKSAATGHLLNAANALSPARGRARPIDAAAVTEVALRIVDEEDLGALTMRRLAQELGVAIATVYSATGGKEDILNSLVEQILAEVPIVDVGSVPWDEGIVAVFTAVHEVFLAHPAVAHLALLRRVTGPTALRTQETILRLLRAGGLDSAAVGRAYATLTSYVMGFTMLRISRMHDSPGGPSFSAGTFPEAAAFAPVLAEETSTAGFQRALRHLVDSFA